MVVRTAGAPFILAHHLSWWPGLARLVVARERHAEFVAYTSFVYELERMMVCGAACGLE